MRQNPSDGIDDERGGCTGGTRMRFRDRGQRARVCRALLASVDQSRLWGSQGPRPRAHVAPPDDESGDAARMLSLCWALWRETDSLPFVELLAFGDERLRRVARLLEALAEGPTAIDAWLERGRSSAGEDSQHG